MKATSFFSSLRAVAAKSPIIPVCQVSAPFAGASVVLALAMFVTATSAPTASAQAVTYAGSGAVNFGDANVCPSGKATPAPCSQTLTLTYDVTESGTLGTPKALTTGQPDLDYKLASGSTCGGNVTKGDTCTVNVAFAPIAPGQRKGAVEIVDAGGSALATTYIYGSGVGPLIGYSSPSATAQRVISAASPYGVAVDASGDAFVSYPGTKQIQELLAVDGFLPTNPVAKAIDLGQFDADQLAIDGAGNLFAERQTSSSAGYAIEVLAAGGYSIIKPVGSGLILPSAIAVDASGNLFVADLGNFGRILPSVKEFLASDNYATGKELGNGYKFFEPRGLAVDGAGNVFVADYLYVDYLHYVGYGAVEEILASGGYANVDTLIAFQPSSVAIDPAGDLFVVLNFGAMEEVVAVNGVVPSNPKILQLGTPSLIGIGPITFEGNGNILSHLESGVRGDLYDQFAELQLAAPPPLAFASTVVGSTSSDSPQSFEIQNRGTAALDLASVSVTGPNWSQVPGSGTPPDCAAGFSLVSDALCNVSISFEPTATGPLTGAVKVVDNHLNAPGSSQSGSLSGNGIGTGPAPQIARLSATYGAAYSWVNVTGTNFGSSKGSSAVTFNGIPAPTYLWTDTLIWSTVPPNANNGNVAVTVNGEASNGVLFTVLPQPQLTGISPTSGPEGTVVTISGKNLVDYENKATVTFDNKFLPVLAETGDAITVAIPSGVATSHFHVLVNDTGMNSPTFTVTK